MIPKTIFTCWFPNMETMPQNIKDCVKSQNVAGYFFKLITLDNVIQDHPYVIQCLNSTHETKKWVKLKDFVQYYYLYHFGGWFLDADVKMLEGKNFNDLLDNDFVIGIESQGTLPDSIIPGSAVLGSSAYNPILKETLDRMCRDFRGDDDKCYESSLDILSQVCIANQDKVKFLDPEYFYPYDHNTGITTITENTICNHLFTKSWKLPTVSIIIPHLDMGIERRKQGLEDLVESIKALNYPPMLIDYIIINGERTVPEKVKLGVEKTKGDYICYAANDMTFDKECLRNAIEFSYKTNKALVSFNEGPLIPDRGNICTHFIIKRDFIPFIGGEIFDTRLTHAGVDNLLWSRAEKHNQAIWCENAKITHNHFSKTGQYDEVYAKGWRNVEEDRNKLKELL